MRWAALFVLVLEWSPSLCLGSWENGGGVGAGIRIRPPRIRLACFANAGSIIFRKQQQGGQGMATTLDELNGSDSRQDSVVHLEYSLNFQRHVMWDVPAKRNGTNGRVRESFLWLDQALQRYPQARRRPFRVISPFLEGNETRSSPNELNPDDASLNLVQFAGVGIEASRPYPIVTVPPPALAHRQEEIQTILHNLLGWIPPRALALMVRMPGLVTQLVDVAWLQERLEFALAPLPTNQTILDQVNRSAVDWPQLHEEGYGAGLSVQVVSTVLDLAPKVLLQGLWVDPLEHETAAASDHDRPAFLRDPDLLFKAMVVTETPDINFDITRRQLEPWICASGTSSSSADLVLFMASYLHWKNIDFSWKQWRIILTAFPGLSLHPGGTPSWELYERGGGSSQGVRQSLKASTMRYLQRRLQIGPGSIHSLLKSHSRISQYSIVKLQTNLNTVQQALGLTSAQLRDVVVSMPNILGSSTDSIRSRVEFWTDPLQGVGLTLDQLQTIILRRNQPSFLTYSVRNNLRAKLQFFRGELGLESLVSMTMQCPDIWGRSLEGHLRPLSLQFSSYFGDNMGLEVFGGIVASTPSLLRYRWENLQTKLDYLTSSLGCQRLSLLKIIQSNPQILFQSIEYSLRPKLKMLEHASVNHGDGGVSQTIQERPWLLTKSASVVQNRIDRFAHSTIAQVNMTLAQALDRSTAATLRPRSKKRVGLVGTSPLSFEREVSSTWHMQKLGFLASTYS
jgi:mTERF